MSFQPTFADCTSDAVKVMRIVVSGLLQSPRPPHTVEELVAHMSLCGKPRHHRGWIEVLRLWRGCMQLPSALHSSLHRRAVARMLAMWDLTIRHPTQLRWPHPVRQARWRAIQQKLYEVVPWMTVFVQRRTNRFIDRALRNRPLVSNKAHLKEHVEALHHGLRHCGKPHVVTLYGKTGVGKTEVVKEFLSRYRAEYPAGVLWWQDSSDIRSTASHVHPVFYGLYHILVFQLGLLHLRDVSDEQMLYHALTTWCQTQSRRWLLIVPSGACDVGCIPTTACGNIIHIESVHARVSYPHPVCVAPLTVAQFVSSLLHSRYVQDTIPEEVVAAVELAEYFGGLPRALQRVLSITRTQNPEQRGDVLRRTLAHVKANQKFCGWEMQAFIPWFEDGIVVLLEGVNHAWVRFLCACQEAETSLGQLLTTEIMGERSMALDQTRTAFVMDYGNRFEMGEPTSLNEAWTRALRDLTYGAFRLLQLAACGTSSWIHISPLFAAIQATSSGCNETPRVRIWNWGSVRHLVEDAHMLANEGLVQLQFAEEPKRTQIRLHPRAREFVWDRGMRRHACQYKRHIIATRCLEIFVAAMERAEAAHDEESQDSFHCHQRACKLLLETFMN